MRDIFLDVLFLTGIVCCVAVIINIIINFIAKSRDLVIQKHILDLVKNASIEDLCEIDNNDNCDNDCENCKKD